MSGRSHSRSDWLAGGTRSRPRWSFVTAILALFALAASALPQGAGSRVPASQGTMEGRAAALSESQRPAAVIDLHGPIDDYSASVLLGHVEAAKRAGAKTLIFHLDTPGGTVPATLELTRQLRALDPEIRTIAYVDPAAYSGGTIFALACDEIVMSPGARMGDCAPIMVTSSGLAPLPAAERAKVVSPLVTEVRASAAEQGYDPLLLEAMLIPERTVHALVNDAGEKRFVSEAQLAEAKAAGFQPIKGVPDPVDAADTLLTVDDATAKAIGLSKGTFASVEAVAAERGLAIAGRYSATGGQRLVGWLNSAEVRGLMVSVFFVSLYLSFQVPGHGLPEAVCLTSLATLLLIPVLTGYASWVEIVMILVGVALVALEIFVVTGTLVPGIIGLLLILGGLILTFVPRELPTVPGEFSIPRLPTLPGTWAALQSGLIAVAGATVLSAVATMFLSRWLPKMPYARRLVLTATAGEGGAGTAMADASQQPWPPLGATAVATTDLRPSGHAEFPNPDAPGTLTLPVVSDSGYIPRGTAVQVIDLQGARILVRPRGGGTLA